MKTKSERLEIKASFLEHRGQRQIALHFTPDAEIASLIKNFDSVRWADTHRCYYIPDTPADLDRLLRHCRGKVWVDITAIRTVRKTEEGVVSHSNQKVHQSTPVTRKPDLPAELLSHLDTFKAWMEQHRYSPQTIRNYLGHLVQFFSFCNTPYNEVTVEDIHHFNHEVIIKGNLSSAYQRGMTGAIKLFYSHFFNHKMDLSKIAYPFRERTLPEVLSKEEIQKIIQSTNNLKHRAMLSVIYSCGLRRSELLGLKISHLDKQRNLIRIVQGKGRKDRYAPYSEKLKKLLREYYIEYRPVEYLFEGQDGGPYSARSLAKVLEQAVEKTRIRKHVTLHTLRHSFATHLLEAGTDIRYIQELLGHANPKTTMIYTHVSSKKVSEIRSPPDDLDL